VAAEVNALDEELPLHRQFPWQLLARNQRQILEVSVAPPADESNVTPMREKQARGAGPAWTVRRWTATPGVAPPFPAGSFDFIILSDTLDTLADRAKLRGERFDPEAFIRDITLCVAPGGTIAGSVRNRLADYVPGVRSPVRAAFSLRACRRLLRSAGCEDIEFFSLHRRESIATLLISTRRDAFRSFALRDLAARRHTLSRSGYLARWLLARSGIGRFFQPELLFAARRS
jgi:hypothetical protein